MIRRSDDTALLLRRCAATPHPGLTAALWQAGFGGLPGALALYRCGGAMLAVHGAAGVLTGRLPPSGAAELLEFASALKLNVLYVPPGFSVPPGCSAEPLLCLCARPVPAPATPVRPQTNYAAAARLLCGVADEGSCADFYADLCARRNRGQVAVLGLGPQLAPDGCIVRSGPLTPPVRWPRKSARCCFLSDLFVLPAARGQGRGSALERAAMAADADELFLYCRQALAPFHAGLGWQPAGRLLALTPAGTDAASAF